MKPATEQNEARSVEDAAWNLKDVAADLVGRTLSDTDQATLASVLRDLERLRDRLVDVRDRRRRRRNGAPASDTAVEEQSEPQETAT